MEAKERKRVSLRLMVRFLRDRPLSLVLGLFLGVMPAVLLPCAVLGALLLGEWDPGRRDEETLRTEGKEVTGYVAGIESDQSTTVNGDYPTVISYRFDADGEPRSGTMKTLENVAGWRSGTEVTVAYLGDQSIIVGVEPYVFPYWLVIAVHVSYIPIGMAFLVHCLLAARKKAILHTRGEMVTATVGRVDRAGPFWPFLRPKWWVTYAFEGKDGRTFRGKSLTTDCTIGERKAGGDEVDVLCLPGNEAVNCVKEQWVNSGPTTAPDADVARD